MCRMTNRMELPAPRGSPAAHEGVDAAAGRAITHGAPAHPGVERTLAARREREWKSSVKHKNPGADRTLRALRRAALRHPDVEEGLACKGTVIESVTFKVQGKAFLFLRPEKGM